MKEALPPTAKIAKESKECIQECVSEFISFVVSLVAGLRVPCCSSRLSDLLWAQQTSEASERCLDGKRKTLNGEDVLEALTALGFDNYVRLVDLLRSIFRPRLTDTGHLFRPRR